MHPILLVVSLVASVAPPVADSLDACALYSRDEVAKLAGENARAPRSFSVNPATHSSCTTTSRSSQWTVKVYIERAPSKKDLQLSLNTLKGVAKGQTSQALKPVTGLGEEAYWGQIGPTNGQFHVVVGTAMIGIQTFGKAPGAGTMDRTRPIADLVIKRYKERYSK